MKIKIIKKDTDVSPKNLKVIAQFAKYSAQKLRIKKDIVLYLLKKDHDVEGISTAGYNPENNDVYVRCGGRALVDALRSIAHEFGHARQKELGAISEDKDIPNIGGVIEDEANAVAGRLIKMFIKDTDQKWIYKD